MKFDCKAYRKGVQKFAEAAGVDEKHREKFAKIVIRESEMAARQVKDAGLTEELTKQASTEETTDLEKAILKVAADSDSEEDDEDDDSESEKSAASMESGQGAAGREALAKRFYDGNEFDHSACVNAIGDESFVDDPDAYCRDLAKLVGRGQEATRGPREGKEPGE